MRASRPLLLCVALTSASVVGAESVFDLLQRSEFTERWFVLPGQDGCGATYRPADGSPVLNGQPSFSLKRSGSGFLSFSSRQAGQLVHPAGTYRVTIADRSVEAQGQAWGQDQPGLRLEVGGDFSRALAQGGALVVLHDGREILSHLFLADSKLVQTLNDCVSRIPPSGGSFGRK